MSELLHEKLCLHLVEQLLKHKHMFNTISHQETTLLSKNEKKSK